MKKVLQFFAVVVLISSLVGLIYYLWRFSKKNDVKSLVAAALLARRQQGLIDITGNGSRFIAQKNDMSIMAFEAYMAKKKYVPVANYGRSTLYSRDGEEVVVKRIQVLKHYLIFEVYNENFFSMSEAA